MGDMRGLLVVAGGMLFVCAACTREQDAAELSPQEEALPSAASMSEEDMAAESSLAIKRGTMTLAEERVSFRLCDDSAELWVLDQTVGQTTQTLIEEAHSAPLELYVEAYGERAAVSDEPQARGYAGLFVLEEILYAGAAAEVTGCNAPNATYIVAARGNEPFWQVEVGEQQIVWRQPEAPKEIVFATPQTQNAEGAVRYTASSAARQLELRIHAQHCTDSMSGEFFAYSAEAVLDDEVFSGCARVGR